MNGISYNDYRKKKLSKKVDKSEQFRKDLEILKEKGVYFVKHSDFHIKVGEINYYSSGVINFDGGCKLDRKGIDFFLYVLKEEGYIGTDSKEKVDERPLKENSPERGVFFEV